MHRLIGVFAGHTGLIVGFVVKVSKILWLLLPQEQDRMVKENIREEINELEIKETTLTLWTGQFTIKGASG